MGIDAGGTKTDCAIGNGAALLGQATGETCKVAQVRETQERFQNLAYPSDVFGSG